MFQNRDEALIRKPGERTYSSRETVAVTAKELWEYAVLSENVYIDKPAKRPEASQIEKTRRPQATQASEEAYRKVCTSDSDDPIPLPGWTRWDNFPSSKLHKEAQDVGLYVEVWEKESSPPLIAVVIRGTEFTSWRDWVSNFRWFFRIIPFYPDQYSVVADKVGVEFLQELKKKVQNDIDRYNSVKLVATGHSLGGGLAQNLAYSLPLETLPDGKLMPRVTSVYAFDPSPVTGWFSVKKHIRETNATGLHIDRVFEHGEILAYLRLIMRYLNPPRKQDPSVREIRYNFVDSINPFSSHSMRLIACALIDAGTGFKVPNVYEISRAER